MNQPGTDPTAAEREQAGGVSARLALLASIVDSSDDAVFTNTLDGTITSWNSGAEAIYGYRADEMIGKPVSILVQQDGADDWDAILESVRHGRRIPHRENVRIRSDRRKISVSLTVSPIHDGSGCVIGTSSIARDITARKQSEDEGRSTSHYARSLIEASLDPLVTISPEGKITDVNEATKGTGVPREKLIGTDFSDYFTEPEKARAGISGSSPKARSPIIR